MSMYPWLQDNISSWHDLLDKKQVPHAILLSGINGVGKIELAKHMAHYALCENLSSKGVCNQCSACALLVAGNHTDLIYISAEKSIIKVEQIRTLSRSINLTTTRSKYKVVIIENAEQMNLSAANALLKTLEEPPQKVIIIITTSEIGKLLATIKSRCIKLNINIPKQSDAVAWLSNNVVADSDEIKLSLNLVNDAPLAAKVIIETKILEQLKNMFDDLNQLATANKTVLEVSKYWYKQEWFYNLNYVAAYYLTQVNIQQGLQTEQAMPNTQLQVDSVPTIVFIQKIHKFMNLLKTPVKVELLLTDLLIYWQKINKR
ncbi:MAG: DNA polymerase III subunit delta' [Proteobacteria bacterium]|nr:DNA polymerase III subunit delta' [Pseudomonadota bacterium]